MTIINPFQRTQCGPPPPPAIDFPTGQIILPGGIVTAEAFGAQTVTVGAAFDGNFSAHFTTPYYFCQADRGLTYGTTPRATAGNTSTTVITQGGTAPTVPVPVTYKATNSLAIGSGGAFSISFDGGSTFAMTGVVPTAGTPVNLTGAGVNITATWSAGTVVNNDTWKATGASFVDQSGNSVTWAQATAANQPIITIGANGHVGLLFDGIASFLHNAAFTQTAGTMLWIIAKQIGTGSFLTIVGSESANNHKILYQDGSSGISMYDSATLAGGVLTIGTIGRIAATFNAVSSSIKVGSNAVVNGTSGSQGLASGRSLGCDRSGTPINFANVEVFAWGEMPAQSFSAADALANTYYGSVAI